jgi:hypothetical protein
MQPRLDVPGMTEYDLGPAAVLGLMPAARGKQLLGDALPEPTQATDLPRSELDLRVNDPLAAHDRPLAAGATEPDDATRPPARHRRA